MHIILSNPNDATQSWDHQRRLSIVWSCSIFWSSVSCPFHTGACRWLSDLMKNLASVCQDCCLFLWLCRVMCIFAFTGFHLVLQIFWLSRLTGVSMNVTLVSGYLLIFFYNFIIFRYNFINFFVVFWFQWDVFLVLSPPSSFQHIRWHKINSENSFVNLANLHQAKEHINQ
jgi:hypothetical protein